MDEGPTPEQWLERGDGRAAAGLLDEAIHCYNQALKKAPKNPLTSFKLSDVYARKAEQAGNAFLIIAMDALRKGLKNDPHNEAAHGKLIALSLKNGSLDELAREYGKKAAEEGKDGFHARQLKRIYVFSLLDNHVKAPLNTYRPAAYVKYFFDLVILPAGVIGILLNNFGPEFRPLFALGASFFLFYCLYRAAIWILTREQ